MSWSKITNKSKKPIGWWLYKLLAELSWFIRDKVHFKKGDKLYRYALDVMCDKYKINLYGEEIK